MRNLRVPAAFVALLTSLLFAAQVVRAASAPTSTPQPASTATPYPTYTPAPSATPVHRPTLTLSSSSGTAGAALLVAAADFPANGTVTLSWDGQYLARDTADDTGYVVIRTAIPADATPGPHELRAIGPGHASAAALFTVTTYSPVLTLTPTQGITGTQVEARATGFAPETSVAFYWDRRDSSGLLGILVTGADGVVQQTFAVGEPRATLTTPLRVTPGAHTVYAVAAHPALIAHASFSVPVLATGAGGPSAPGNPCGDGEFALAIPLPVIGGTVCIPTMSFIGDVVTGLANLLVGAVGTVMSPFTNALTIEPRIDTSLVGADLFHYAYGLGIGIAGSFYVLAGLHYLRNATRKDFEPFFTLQDAVLGGLYMGGMPLWTPILFTTGQWLTDRIKNHVGALALASLGRVFSDLVKAIGGNAGLAIVDLFTGVLMFVFGLLVGLIRLIGVYGLGWLYIVGVMAMATWIYPVTRGIATRWFAAFCAILLWPVGWAVALQIIAVVWLWLPTSDPAWDNPLMQALSAVSALVLLFVTPRLVDMLIGTGIAGVSGAYALTEGIIGGLVGEATAALSRGKRGAG